MGEMRARRTLVLTDDQRRALVRLRDHDARPFVRERAAALLKIADGQSPHQVARNGLLRPRDPDTVYSWLDLYETEGVAGLDLRRHGGRRRVAADDARAADRPEGPTPSRRADRSDGRA
jgi:hypothetical protein